MDFYVCKGSDSKMQTIEKVFQQNFFFMKTFVGV